MPKWLFDFIDSRLLPQSDSRIPCAMVMLAGDSVALHVGDGDGHVAADVLFARLAHLRPELHERAKEDSRKEYCFLEKVIIFV